LVTHLINDFLCKAVNLYVEKRISIMRAKLMLSCTSQLCN